jgi:hypothetical protein
VTSSPLQGKDTEVNFMSRHLRVDSSSGFSFSAYRTCTTSSLLTNARLPVKRRKHLAGLADAFGIAAGTEVRQNAIHVVADSHSRLAGVQYR